MFLQYVPQPMVLVFLDLIRLLDTINQNDTVLILFDLQKIRTD